MKIKNIALAGLVALTGITSCEDNLDLVNPNQQTTAGYGSKPSDLEETVIACYNRIRIEGTYARVGYLLDVVAGDEVNSYSDNDWWRPYDYLNASQVVTNDDSPLHWIFRDFYYTINTCNQLLFYVENSGLDPNSEAYKRAKGQGLFIRALSYYELACYYQDIPLITDFNAVSINDLMASTNTQSEVFDQVEKDLKEAMDLLPSRDEGGEWASGRATCGAAAGYYARTLMFRHKFADALTVLKDIIAGNMDITPSMLIMATISALLLKIQQRAFGKFSSSTMALEVLRWNGLPQITLNHLLRDTLSKPYLATVTFLDGTTSPLLLGSIKHSRVRRPKTAQLTHVFIGHLFLTKTTTTQ